MRRNHYINFLISVIIILLSCLISDKTFSISSICASPELHNSGFLLFERSGKDRLKLRQEKRAIDLEQHHFIMPVDGVEKRVDFSVLVALITAALARNQHLAGSHASRCGVPTEVDLLLPPSKRKATVDTETFLENGKELRKICTDFIKKLIW